MICLKNDFAKHRELVQNSSLDIKALGLDSCHISVRTPVISLVSALPSKKRCFT